MSKRPDITPVGSGYNSATSINNNFTEVSEAFDNTLSRDGSTPNQMEADLDLNSNDLLNVKDLSVVGELTLGGKVVTPSQSLTEATNFFQQLSGDGTTTVFTLSQDPISKVNTQVFINGVYQQKETYSVTGTTLTFVSAPPTGTRNIEINSQKPSSASGLIEVGDNPTFESVTVGPTRIESTGYITGGAGGELAGYLTVNAGGEFNGLLNMRQNRINGLATPTDSDDAANKGYVDSAVSGGGTTDPTFNTVTVGPTTLEATGYLTGGAGGEFGGYLTVNAGGEFNGLLNMRANRINGLATPADADDAANKGYVDTAISGVTYPTSPTFTEVTVGPTTIETTGYFTGGAGGQFAGFVDFNANVDHNNNRVLGVQSLTLQPQTSEPGGSDGSIAISSGVSSTNGFGASGGGLYRKSGSSWVFVG